MDSCRYACKPEHGDVHSYLAHDSTVGAPERLANCGSSVATSQD